MSDPEELDDDRPWTEDQWEAFMKRSDARSAKFGELLETLMDHPDRDGIIDREMGWDGPDNEEFQEIIAPAAEEVEGRKLAENDASEDDDADDLSFGDDWPFDEDDPAEAAGSDDADDYIRQRKDALKGMPAYSRAFEFGLQVHDALEPYCGQHRNENDENDNDENDDNENENDEDDDNEDDDNEDDDNEDDDDPDLSDAIGGSMTIAAKLAGGHGMGYDDDVLCGNIVCCKRSLAGAEQCLRGGCGLRDRGTVPPAVIDPLIQTGEQVRTLVEERIAELRSRVWWE